MAYIYDWKIGVQPLCKPVVPTFVGLFILNRLLNNLGNSHVAKHLKKMHDQTVAQNILKNLTNNGIKKYMADYNKLNDDEKNKIARVIDLIFDQIIRKHHSKEYENILTFNFGISNVHDPNFICTRLFNTCDLMYLIFQFIDLTDICKNISLVCSHWFYYAFNPRSTMHNFVTLPSHPQAKIELHTMHRFYNAKSLILCTALHRPKRYEAINKNYKLQQSCY